MTPEEYSRLKKQYEEEYILCMRRGEYKKAIEAVEKSEQLQSSFQ